MPARCACLQGKAVRPSPPRVAWRPSRPLNRLVPDQPAIDIRGTLGLAGPMARVARSRATDHRRRCTDARPRPMPGRCAPGRAGRLRDGVHPAPPTRIAKARSYGGSPASRTRSSAAICRNSRRPVASSAVEPALACAITLAERSMARTQPLPIRCRTTRAATPGPQPISSTRIPGRSGKAATISASLEEIFCVMTSIASLS